MKKRGHQHITCACTNIHMAFNVVTKYTFRIKPHSQVLPRYPHMQLCRHLWSQQRLMTSWQSASCRLVEIEFWLADTAFFLSSNCRQECSREFVLRSCYSPDPSLAHALSAFSAGGHHRQVFMDNGTWISNHNKNYVLSIAWAHQQSAYAQLSPLHLLSILYITLMINYSRPFPTFLYCKQQKKVLERD